MPIAEQFNARRAAIATLIEILDKHKGINEKERRHAVQKLVLSVIDSGADASGPFSKIVNGVGTTVGSYRYTNDANQRFCVMGGAGVAYGIGNAIAVEEVVRDGVTGEIKHKQDRNQHQLLVQILSRIAKVSSYARRHRLAEALEKMIAVFISKSSINHSSLSFLLSSLSSSS